MRVNRLVPGTTVTRSVLLAVALGTGSCKDKETATATPPPPPEVTLGPENVATARLTRLLSGPTISGTLTADRDATVRAEVGGTVLRTLVEPGESVSKGTLLLRQDDTAIRDSYLSAKSAVRTAQSAVEIARRNAERAARLAEAGALAERDLETARWNVTDAEATLADAEARLATAQKQLAHTEIRAPFGGRVSERQVNAGDVVQVGAALYTIVDLASLRLEASVPVEALTSLRVGMPVDFGVSGLGAKTFRGRIERINPAVDPATRQVRIYVTIPNAGRSLVVGLYAEGRVATETKTAVAAPLAAIDLRGANPQVARLRASVVEHVPVTLGLRDDVAQLIAIASGVGAGDTLLLGSAQGLSEGARVKILEEAVTSER